MAAKNMYQMKTITIQNKEKSSEYICKNPYFRFVLVETVEKI